MPHRPPFLLALLLLLFTAPAAAQIELEQGNLEVLTDDHPVWSRPGVRYRSQSRGVAIRYETQPQFAWKAGEGLKGGKQTVTHLEQFTFKFKIPLLNTPQNKLLLGYEWDTEKYFFSDPYRGFERQPTLFQLLDERRLKANKLSAYFTHSWDERFYTSARLRMSLNGDYQGLIDFGSIYRTYSAAAVYGKKVSPDEEWAVGITYSNNKARQIALPFFVYNRTFNPHWGIQTALPGQAYLRRNVGKELMNTFLLGATFDSRYYALNTEDRGNFSELGQFFLRNNGVRAMLQYEHNLSAWVWAFGQAGYYLPVNTRFNPASDIDLDLETTVEARPFFRVGVFLAPPKEFIK
ncbi:hypothetical protein GGR26_001804 [Lewinella marina]|uniref:Uncharacterized protein n=1 Tax=Neolewinella marina TaxID=438751 RepID=A0A2G0CDE2_9BACT|nr:hypothetical protein [Neolewinella marina]NJB86036.1 hypothetical protein [Neolewinella marina]PHK97998.1 hypothetical protein CGL56_12455 [Neolewinella marina]